MAALISLIIYEFIKRYRQKSSFVLCIDDRVIPFDLPQEDELMDILKEKVDSQIEGEEPEYELKDLRADGGRIVVSIRKAPKKEVKLKVEPVIIKDEKLEKLKEKKLKK